MKKDLTEGNIIRGMLSFSVPYLISCFLQTFYGMADLFITGQFNGAASISAVAVGSQIMHMLTVMIVGLAMGSTVTISRCVGARDEQGAARGIGNTVSLFMIVSVAVTAILLFLADPILRVMAVPEEAFSEARRYVMICFAGIPFITAYNVISSIFRGLGDTRRPMYFVAIAGLFNVGLDYLLIGPFGMGAAGAALATVISQAGSVLLALLSLRRFEIGVRMTRGDLRFASETVGKILGIGVPIAFQEGLIQISFLVITAIANSRGVDIAAAVGIVEKIICFLFLVPSAMLSTVSALAAQNAGAGKHDRSREVLRTGVVICVVYGAVIFLICQFAAEGIISCFVHDNAAVVTLGSQYLRSYTIDCMFAGVHFCFSGFFSAYGRSVYSFFHNMLSAICIRIPGAWLASVLFPLTLYPMGLAAPAGSLVSTLICLVLYRRTEWK